VVELFFLWLSGQQDCEVEKEMSDITAKAAETLKYHISSPIEDSAREATAWLTPP
jgi:hypothetical protein